MNKFKFDKYDAAVGRAYFICNYADYCITTEIDYFPVLCGYAPNLEYIGIEGMLKGGIFKISPSNNMIFDLGGVDWTWLNIITYFYGSHTNHDANKRMTELFGNLKGTQNERNIESQETNNIIVEHE